MRNNYEVFPLFEFRNKGANPRLIQSGEFYPLLEYSLLIIDHYESTKKRPNMNYCINLNLKGLEFGGQ